MQEIDEVIHQPEFATKEECCESEADFESTKLELDPLDDERTEGVVIKSESCTEWRAKLPDETSPKFPRKLQDVLN